MDSFLTVSLNPLLSIFIEHGSIYWKHNPIQIQQLFVGKITSKMVCILPSWITQCLAIPLFPKLPTIGNHCLEHSLGLHQNDIHIQSFLNLLFGILLKRGVSAHQILVILRYCLHNKSRINSKFLLFIHQFSFFFFQLEVLFRFSLHQFSNNELNPLQM
jgi:hypothetical protein